MIEEMSIALKRLTGCIPNSPLCNIDKSLTPQSTLIIIFTFIFTLATLYIIKNKLSHPFQRFGIMALGVLMFELFTAPMWNTYHLGKFAYYYLDLSWVLTLCWTSMFILDVTLIDKLFPKMKELQRFLLSLLLPLAFTFIGELWLVQAGVRTYAPEVIQTSLLLLGGVPIEVLYYAPVFSSFIIAFYKFWMFHLDKIPLVPMKKKVTVRNFLICAVGIFMFELLIEPLIENNNFPIWSYIYRDISVVRIGLWIILIASGTTLVDKLFYGMSQFPRYLMYISSISVVFFQMESWLISHGYRVYLESATANFSGFTTPASDIPIEIAFAIPLYLALIIAFLRYWRVVWDNNL